MANLNECYKTNAGTTVTAKGRLSYVSLLRTNPRAKNLKTGQEKYTTSLLLPPGSDLTILRADADAAAKEKWGDNIPKGLKTPFLDAEDKMGEEWKGWVLLRVSSMNRPAIVDARGMDVTDEVEVYSGRWARLSVRAGAYVSDMNKGVSFFLSNVQLLDHDEPLGGGRINPENEFVPVAEGAGTGGGVFD